MYSLVPLIIGTRVGKIWGRGGFELQRGTQKRFCLYKLEKHIHSWSKETPEIKMGSITEAQKLIIDMTALSVNIHIYMHKRTVIC